MPVLPTPSLAATLSLALLGASCSLTTDLSGLQRGTGGGGGSTTATTTTSTTTTTTSTTTTTTSTTTTTTSTTSSSSSIAMCGDGIIQGEEECDDESSLPGDGCVDCVVQCEDDEIKGPEAHCYRNYGDLSLNFSDATKVCAGRKKKSTLITITSEAEVTFLVGQGLMTYDTWLGATEAVLEGQYTWLTDEPWVYERWAMGNPNTMNGTLICVMYSANDLLWRNAFCYDGKHLICESSPPGKTAP